MANKQIYQVTRKSGTPSTSDLILLDQYSGGSYVTRSATVQQLADAIKPLIPTGGGEEEYDSVNLDYTSIPLAYSDVNGEANAVTLKSDGALYATSYSKLDDFYVKYPGYGWYQRITSKYIPGWSSNYHLNLPPGTMFYSTLTSTGIAAYLRVAQKQLGTYVDQIGQFWCSKEKGTTGNVKTDEEESGGMPGVFYWGELVKSSTSSSTSNRLCLYARNSTSKNVYSRVTGTKISRMCEYWKGDTEYGDKGVYKTVTLTKKTPVITPGSSALIAQFPVYKIPSTIPYDDTGWFYYDIYLQDWLYVTFYSIGSLR